MRHLEAGQDAAPAGGICNPAPGRRREHRPAGHYEPPARSWLTTEAGIPRRKRGPTLRMTGDRHSRRRGGAPRGAPASVVRRWSFRRRTGLFVRAGHGVRRSAPAPFGASPPFFWRDRMQADPAP